MQWHMSPVAGWARERACRPSPLMMAWLLSGAPGWCVLCAMRRPRNRNRNRRRRGGRQLLQQQAVAGNGQLDQVDRRQLDQQLEAYMARTRSHLDAELDAYMAQASSTGSG